MSSYQVKQKGRMPEAHYQKIQTNFCYLGDHIKEPVRLGNELFEKNVFNVDEKDEIKKIYLNAEQGRWAAADKLLMYVLNSGDTYGKFIQCLQEIGYREIVNVLENTTNVKQKGRMPEAHYQKIQTNFCYLGDHIKEPVRLGNELFEKNVFNVDEKDEIKKIYLNAEQGRWAAADKLLMYVLNSGDTYGKFIQCLQEIGYREIVNVLENTTNGKNKTNLMTEQDKTRHQLEELHKDHDLTKQELENLKKQMETLKTRQDGDIKQMLKKIKKLETYKKQTEEKEVLTKKRMDELETCIKTLTLNDEDTRQQQQQQLFIACQHGSLDDIKNIVNIDVNVRDGLLDQTPLFKCCESSVSPVDKIKYLVSHQANINARDSINNTILHWACVLGTLSTVECLVDDLHMDVNTTSWSDRTPLFKCCISSVRSPVDKIKYLVSRGADIYARDSGNHTILHRACDSSTLSTVQYLVDCLHLDLHVKNKAGETPLDYCRWSFIESHEKIKYITDQMKLK